MIAKHRCSSFQILTSCLGAGVTAQCHTMAGYQRIILVVDQLLFSGYSVPTNFNELINEEVSDLLDGSA